MNVIQEIAAWAKKLPGWQSDAIRRLFVQRTITTEDEDELLAMLLFSHNVEDDGPQPPEPILFSSVVAEAASGPLKVILKELHSAVGVNALVPNQSILFALEGLTVIYGENGAGKSGYTRILKHACHAREKGEPILNDVAIKEKVVPTAMIELTVNGADASITWTDKMPPSAHLAEIAVFDSHCARVFLDEANEAIYLPYGFNEFKNLATLITSLKNRLRVRLNSLPQRLAIVDEFSPATTAGRFVHTLTDKSDSTQVEAIAFLDATANSRLIQLRSLVAAAKVNPPKQQASQLRRRKARIDQLKQKVVSIEDVLSADNIGRLTEAHRAATVAAQAAEVASTEAFANDPVPMTGSNPWRVLFESAKEFSEQSAYPGKEFPVVDSTAVCVLCQQNLDAVAIDRFNRFKAFVINDAAQKKSDCDKLLRTCRDAVAGADAGYLSKDATLLEEIRAHSAELAEQINAYFQQRIQIRNAALSACADGDWSRIPTRSASVETSLQKMVDDLEAAAVDFDRADKPEELARLEQELAELNDRELLGKYAEDIKAFIKHKQQESKLKLCDRELDTTPITRFVSDLMTRAVTERLESCLVTELASFSLRSVPLQLKKSGEKGKTRHQLTIQNGARPTGVLSEGEQRVVAIASFLAELAAVDHSSPIVFDDPVSSLDHLYREKVANRIVQEGKRRQVIVFTHDITMLLALERECAEQRVELLVHTVRRSAAGPGECPDSGSRPWHAMTTSDRIGYLKNVSAPYKKLQATSPDDYRVAVESIYGMLREAWERAIEEVLFNDTIQRFRPSIETNRLKRICFEATDFATINTEMSKCSTIFSGHDTAPALRPEAPSPDEVTADIKKLESFIKALRERQKKASELADDLTKPPTARVAARASSIPSPKRIAV